MKRQFLYFTIATLMLLPAIGVNAQIDSPSDAAIAGVLELKQSIIANGGEMTEGGVFAIDATIGEPIAGRLEQVGQYRIYNGFWTPNTFAPTAATVPLGGRITTANGRGIRSVRVTLTAPNGETRTVMSGTFGNYRFTDVFVGETYIISVTGKKYFFGKGIQTVNLTEERTDVDFVAEN
jgi:hypothetical protein